MSLTLRATTPLRQAALRGGFGHSSAKNPALPAYVAPRKVETTGSTHRRGFASGGTQHQKKATPTPNPPSPRITLKDLGANRTVRIVVLVALSIFGTMETIFWAKVIWAKFFQKAESEEGGSEKI